MQLEAALHLVPAIAGDHGDVVVVAGLVVARRPAEQAGGGIKAGACWQIAQQQRDGVAIGVGSQQRQAQALALAQGLVGQGIDDRHMVGAGHGQHEAAQSDTAPAVDHAQQHLAVGAVSGRGRPLERGKVAEAGGAALNQRSLCEAHALGAADDLPEEQTPVAVLRAQGAGPGLAGLGRRQVGAVEVEAAVGLDLAELRRQVVIGQGVDAMAQVELGPLTRAWRAAQAAGRAHADGLGVQRLAGLERSALQRCRQVKQPKLGLLGLALRSAEDGVTEVAAGVEQQRERALEIVGADVGDADVVAQGAGQAVGAGVAEGEQDEVGDVRDRREHEVEGHAQVELLHAAQAAGDLQAPAPRRQIGQAQDGALAGAVPAHAFGVQHEMAVGAGGDQAVVAGGEHRRGSRGVVTGRAGPHGLVEADRQLAQRQRHQGAVADAGRDEPGRFGGGKFVDAGGLRDEHAAIGGGDDALAAAAAVGQLEPAPGGQLDGPDRAAARQRATAAGHGALRGVGAGQQQAGQGRAGLAEGEAVDQAGDAVRQLGAAGVAPAERQADDLAAGFGQGAVDGAAGPAHGPQPAVGPEGELTHTGVAEVLPGLAGDGFLGVEGLDAIAAGDIDQPGAGVDSQGVGQGLAAGGAAAADDGAAAGVDQEQLSAGHRPEVAVPVCRQVEHRRIQREQRLHRAAAVLGKAEDLFALGPGAGEHAAVGQLDHGERADVALAGPKAAGEAAQLKWREHRLQIAAQAAQGRIDDQAGQGLRGQGEQAARVVAAPGRGGRQLGAGREHLGQAQGLLGRAAAAVVGQHRTGHAGGLAVAGVVGGRRQKLIALAGHAGEQRRAFGAGHLLLPDLEVTAILGHINGDVLDARGVIGGLPVEQEGRLAAGVIAVAGDAERGAGRAGVQGVADGRAGDRRGGVEEDAGRR